MAAIGIAFIVVLFAVAAPVALYWFVRAEEPDPDRTASWDTARSQARNDARDRRDGERADRDGERADRDERGTEDEVGGNHWG
jgi:hypothetical protein